MSVLRIDFEGNATTGYKATVTRDSKTIFQGAGSMAAPLLEAILAILKSMGARA